MKIYLVIATEDIEITGVRVFLNRSDAEQHLEEIGEGEEETDVSEELDGTLRMIGDDAYMVQLIEREVV